MLRTLRYLWRAKRLSRNPLRLRRFHSHNDLIGLLRNGYFSDLLPSKSEKYLNELPYCSIYMGVDPSADSLQLGNLVPLMGLLRCHLLGYEIITVVSLFFISSTVYFCEPEIGTGTAMVGDPSGRLTKRTMQSSNQFEVNTKGIENDLKTVFQNYREQFFPRIKHSEPSQSIRTLQNIDWLGKFSCLEFIDHVALHFRVPELLEKERQVPPFNIRFVKLRLESGNGMDLGEFLYPALQAADFLHLYENYNCRVQIGGQDQLGNINCGLTLIQRKLGKHAFGLTVPLLTTQDGTKFGKSSSSSEVGSTKLWLSKSKLLPYTFYQQILNFPDSMVSAKLLRQLTFFTPERIDSLMKDHANSSHNRPVQRSIAQELTLLVHGVDGLQSSELATRIFFPRRQSTVGQTKRTAVDVINEDLNPTERNYLMECLHPNSGLLPVIHADLPVGHPSIGEWFRQVLLQTIDVHSDSTTNLKACMHKGISLNDVVLFKPSNATSTDGRLVEPNVFADSMLIDRINTAIQRRDSATGLSILKIGKHDHWFLATRTS
ncbi:Tyrosine--tRNA ligase [Paragonimus heterotremus]|uniref:Tyrosine--tRNA ligase n=1 Tax=Paragonimus heterotremus TaxID=100268 RepID=A0A8J4TKK6_9TREM|nr:Tyrosine--tRNA ligase [Paragonimus heterotremus]